MINYLKIYFCNISSNNSAATKKYEYITAANGKRVENIILLALNLNVIVHCIDKIKLLFSQQIQGQQIVIHSTVQQPNQNQIIQSPQVIFYQQFNNSHQY